MGQKYGGVTVSGYNSTPPSDAGAQTDENKIKWSYHKTKIGDPLNTAIAAINTALNTRFDESAQLKTSLYNTTLGDHYRLIEVTGTTTINLLDAVTGTAGYQVNIINTGVAIVTVGRATVGNTINGVAGNWTLNPGNAATFRVNSTTNGYDVLSTGGSGEMFSWGGTAGGTANALTITVTPAVTALTAGHTVRFVTGSANTSAATLAVNGLTATAIVKEGNVALVAGDMPANSLMQVTYNGTNYRLTRTTATGLTDVVHLTGNETIAGIKTFSSPVVSAGSSITGVVHDTGAETIAGAKTFSAVVIAPDATLATHLVTKSQLDAKVYGGQITNNGTAAIPYGPSGWTVSRSSLGITVVTHNLGTTSYAVTATTVAVLSRGTRISAFATNNFTINTFNTVDGALTDTDYHFVVSRN